MSRLFTPSLSLSCLGLLLIAAPLSAQQDERVVRKGAVAPRQELAPQVDQGQLLWEALETHGNVLLEIGGQDIQLKKNFTDGEKPRFDAFKDDLKPGIYSYRIQFIPNQIQEDKDHLQGILGQRRKLLALRELKMEQGDAEAAKRLYQEANKLRETATEQLSQAQNKEYEIFQETGQIVVDKAGQVKIYDLKKSQLEAREKELRDKALNPPQREREGEGERRLPKEL